MSTVRPASPRSSTPPARISPTFSSVAPGRRWWLPTSPPGRVEAPLPGAIVTDLEGNEVTTWSLSDRTVFVAEEPGLYTAERGSRRLRVAVILADPERSAVNATGFTPGTSAAATTTTLGAVEPSVWGDELWMLLLTIAVVLIIGEWVTYHRRLTV